MSSEGAPTVANQKNLGLIRDSINEPFNYIEP